jgi:hypothetical protein
LKLTDHHLLLSFAFANAILYRSLLPLWEGFDEPWHYGYVRHFASARSLPVLGETRLPQEIWDSMLTCPASHVVHGAWSELQTFDAYFKLSPADRARERHALETIPRNNSPGAHANYEIQRAPLAYAIYAVPDWLLSRAAIPVRILWLRIFASVLAAFVTLVSAEHLFRTLELPRAYRVLGVYCIFACQMYWATVAHIANDGLALAISIWFFAALAAFSKQPDRGSAWLGLAAALGLLTKAYFVPLTAFTVCWIAYRRARMLPIFAGLVAALAGPWYLRNLLLYHNLSGLLMASAGISPRQAIASLARVDFSRAIPYMLRATLWTGNNSFTTFSAATLNALLALLAGGLLLYAIHAIRRRPPNVWA